MSPASARPGAASLALVAIALITAAWWALALWPAGDVVPEWLARTRAACFGAVRGGLPDAGGWILLIGEPIGMVAVLLAVWGRALRHDLRVIRADRRWRRIAMAAGAVMLLAGAGFAHRMAFALGIGRDAPSAPGTAVWLDAAVPGIVLTDQHGNRVSLREAQGRPVLLTFAFGHCATVCPSIVRDVVAARRSAGRADIRVVVVSLDPWRDTPERLATIAAGWPLGPDDLVLSGPVEDVEAVLDAFDIPRRRDPATGDIDHQGAVLGIAAGGRVSWRLDGGWARAGELLAALAPSDDRAEAPNP